MRRSPEFRRSMFFLSILLALLLFTLHAGAQTAPSGPLVPSPANQNTTQSGPPLFPPSQVKEELVGELSPGADLATARSSENHLAWVEKAAGKKTVRLDGKQIGGVYDDVRYLEFSKDEQHVAFIAKRQSKWVVVVDGVDRSREYGKMTAATLSANGKFFAVGTCVEKKCRLVVNEEEIGPEFEDISAPGFNAAGDHCVYFGKRNKKWVMVLDNKESGPEMDDFAFWRFSPDGNGTVVASQFKSDWTWVVNGTPGPSLDVIGYLDFSSDSKHFAYGGTEAQSGFKKSKTHGVVVVDGRVAGTYEGKGFGGGWQGLFGVTQQIITGPRHLFPDFHGVSDVQYTPDDRLVYAGRQAEGNVTVFLDGTPGPLFEDIVSSIVVSADGKHLAYIGKKGESFVEVRDQVPGPSFPGKRELSFVETMAMSKDGSHLAYEIVRGGNQFKEGRTRRALRRMIIDSKAGPEYDANDLNHFRFAEDGAHYFYEIYGAVGDRDRVVFDGQDSKIYDTVFRNSTKFIDETTIEFVVQEGRRFLRVLETLK
ncbi:MAG TPA: hypothetical protein VE263_06000 [Candidatus Angelobacter sp.]|nr:hypothetical protein [Candidatus Angelobacter sp.]